MSEKPLGFHFNQQFVSLTLGVIALFGSVFTVATWVNDRGAYEVITNKEIVSLREDMNDAINRGQSRDDKFAQTVDGLGEKMDTVNDSVIQLSLDVRELQTLNRSDTLMGLNFTNTPKISDRP